MYINNLRTILCLVEIIVYSKNLKVYLTFLRHSIFQEIFLQPWRTRFQSQTKKPHGVLTTLRLKMFIKKYFRVVQDETKAEIFFLMFKYFKRKNVDLWKNRW